MRVEAWRTGKPSAYCIHACFAHFFAHRATLRFARRAACRFARRRKNLYDAEVEQRDKTTDRMFTLLENMSGDGPAPPKNSKEELEKKMEGYLAQAELRTGPFKDYYLEQAKACLEKLKKDFGG